MLLAHPLVPEAGGDVPHPSLQGPRKDLLQARPPTYLFTPKGVVGLVAIFPINSNQIPQDSQFSEATYLYGDRPGRGLTTQLLLLLSG